MRSKIAIALAVLGVLLLGLGIGQRTLWLPPATVSASVPADVQGAPVTELTSGLLAGHQGPVTLKITSDGPILLATGAKDDVEAWIGKSAHVSVTGADADFKNLSASFSDGDKKVPNPSGSDLWQTEQTGSKELSYTWDASASPNTAILLASDGTSAAPKNITATVQNDTATPWAVPLIVIGALALLVGLVMLLVKPRPDKGRRGVSSGPRDGGTGTAGRRANAPVAPAKDSSTAPRVVLKTGAALALTALVATSGAAGASADTATPSDSSAASPSGSAQATTAAYSAPVVDDAQFSRILDAVAKAAAAGDTAKDAAQLSARFDGAALAIRTGNYKVRSQDSSYAAVAPVTSSKLLTKTISTDREWPRTITAVTQGADNTVPQILTMTQQTPRDNYKLVASTLLLPGQTLPLTDKAGAAAVALDDKNGLAYSPKEAAAAVADRLSKPTSAFKDKIPDNAYISALFADQQKAIDGSKDADLTFTHQVSDGSVKAFKAADGGALVTVNLVYNVTAKPKEDGASISVSKDSAVFTGGSTTTSGFERTSTESVLLFIPAADSKTPLTLLAANQGITGAAFK